jgi:DNA-binding IclR family transcriptional regulator
MRPDTTAGPGGRTIDPTLDMQRATTSFSTAAATTPGSSPLDARPALQSVTIALDIVDTLAAAPELGLSELARRIGVAKSTAHRTCSVLTERGLLDRTPSGGYRLGLRLVEYGHLATTRSAVRDCGLPLLVELRNILGETVQIGVPSGVDVVYVERVEGMRALRYSTENSRRSPLHRSSAGKALAAFNPDLAEARLRAGLPPSTGYTIVVPEVLLAELAEVRTRGYARSVDETELGMSSLAVPVRARPDGAVVAAISMVGPTTRVVDDHEAYHVSVLRMGARKLTDAIGTGEYALGATRAGRHAIRS